MGGKVGINSMSYGGASLNQSCFSALEALILLLGSIYNISFINLSPFSLITPLVIFSLNFEGGYLWKERVLAYFWFLQPGQDSSVGVPNVLNMRSIYSASYLPINNGYLLTSSANIHPNDQISKEGEY